MNRSKNCRSSRRNCADSCFTERYFGFKLQNMKDHTAQMPVLQVKFVLTFLAQSADLLDARSKSPTFSQAYLPPRLGIRPGRQYKRWPCENCSFPPEIRGNEFASFLAFVLFEKLTTALRGRESKEKPCCSACPSRQLCWTLSILACISASVASGTRAVPLYSTLLRLHLE